MTQAQNHLKKLQRKHPTRFPTDYVEALWTEIAPELPGWMHELRAVGKLVVGEVGDPTPDLGMQPFKDGSYAVAINAGYIDFLYAFGRAVTAGFTSHVEGKTIPPSLARRPAIAEFKRVIDGFKRGQRVFHGGFPADRQHITEADELCRCAEIFLLAHELGHVAIDEGRDAPGTGHEETDADAWAMTRLTYAGRRIGHRMLFAGAFFGVRTIALLVRLGVKFSDSHPPPARRLQAMEDAARPLLGEDGFLKAITITVATDEFIEGLENEALTGKPDTLQTPLRVSVRLRAMFEEVVRGRLSGAKFVEELKNGFNEVPRALLLEQASAFFKECPPPALAALDAALPQLPAALRATFEQARGRAAGDRKR